MTPKTRAMSRKESVFTLLLLSLFGPTYSCLKDPAAAYRHSGAVCRLTYPAAAVCEFEMYIYLILLIEIGSLFQGKPEPGVKSPLWFGFFGFDLL